MKAWGTLGFLVVLLVGSCAASEQALFDAQTGVTPISDGDQYRWSMNGSDDPSQMLYVSFVAVGTQYEIYPLGSEVADSTMTLFQVTETAANDYIAQIEPRTGGVFYAFLWPAGEDRYITPFPLAGQYPLGNTYCEPEGDQSCVFRTADDLRRYYVEEVYPALETGHLPANFVEVVSTEQLWHSAN